MYSSLVPRTRAEYHPTFTTIFKRMKNHHIHLYNYIDSDLKVYESIVGRYFVQNEEKNQPSQVC